MSRSILEKKMTDSIPPGWEHLVNNPTPGSPEAGKLGCTCAVLDNHYGKGFPWPSADNPRKDGMSFWVTGGCPLHAPHGIIEPTEGD